MTAENLLDIVLEELTLKVQDVDYEPTLKELCMVGDTVLRILKHQQSNQVDNNDKVTPFPDLP
jgi:hypothetical protein